MRIILVIVALVYASACAPEDPAAKELRYADIACREWVKQRLKAPTTATFPVEGRVRKTSVTDFTVESHVDSQNAFGAMLRMQYVCRGRHSDDNWSLVDIKFSN